MKEWVPEPGTVPSFLTSVCFVPRHAQSLHAGPTAVLRGCREKVPTGKQVGAVPPVTLLLT